MAGEETEWAAGPAVGRTDAIQRFCVGRAVSSRWALTALKAVMISRWTGISDTRRPALTIWRNDSRRRLRGRRWIALFVRRDWRNWVDHSSPLVPEEGFDLVMRPAKVKDEGFTLALEHQSQIQPAATFHEGSDASQSQSRMQVRLPVGGIDGLHGGQNLPSSSWRDALEETRRRQQFHGARSASSVTSRNCPVRRARAVSRRMAAPALANCAAVSLYSAAK